MSEYAMLCPTCGGTPDDLGAACETCGRAQAYPTLAPARWWRDDETRYLSRAEYSDSKRRPHFNLSEIPRGDDPELDAFVEHWRDTHGFFPAVPLPPFEFEQFDPDPLADVFVAMRYPPPPLKMTGWFFDLVDGESEDD